MIPISNLLQTQQQQSFMNNKNNILYEIGIDVRFW